LQHLAQYAISELFASRGANVFLLDLFPESTMKAAADLRESTGGNVVGIPCDVADATAVAAAFDKIKAAGRVDCMINNAGIAAVGNVETATDAIMDRVYNVNVKGVFHCLQESCKAMTSDNKGGVIVNLASVSLACLY
jgi:2-keto-3-deoxy-L-fuconate dehydrogenase